MPEVQSDDRKWPDINLGWAPKDESLGGWPVNKASDIVCLHLQKHLMTELNQTLTKYMPQMFLRCSSKWKLLCKEFGGEEGVYLRECLP